VKGKEILVDTNIIIYLLQGNDTLENVLQGKQLYVSFMTELELFGLNSAPDGYEKKVEVLLNDCLIVPMNASIKHHYKILRKSHKLKLIDSLIAATALALDIPLVTADKQFKAVKHLKLIQYERY
jgi:predicted nucleic acid-binding protein